MKKVLLVLLILCPLFVNAECNRDKHQEYVKISDKITYDNSYSKSASSFTITVYNIFEGMYAEYNNKKYNPNSDGEVEISNIPGGENVVINIYADDGCDAIKRITKVEPYFNPYYGSSACLGYEDKLSLCSNQFTSSEVTKDRLDKAIYNYNNDIDQTTDTRVVDEEPTLYSRVREFLLNWGIKIVLLVVTTVLSIAIFSDKFRKVKHGI